jgi:hypothetical protein
LEATRVAKIVFHATVPLVQTLGLTAPCCQRVTGPVNIGGGGGDGVTGGGDPADVDLDEERDGVEVAGESGKAPPLADVGSKLGADTEAFGVMGFVSSTGGTRRETRGGSPVGAGCGAR